MTKYKIILASVIVSTFLTLVVVFSGSPVYRATFGIMLNRGLVYTMVKHDPKAYQEFILYQKNLILSPPVVQRTIRELHLETSEKFMGKDIEKELRKYIQVKIVGDNLINIEVDSNESAFSARLAQALADNYKAAMDKAKFADTAELKQWILTISPLAKEIKDKEEELKQLKAGEDSQGSLLLRKNINYLEEQKELLEAKLAEAENIYRETKAIEDKPIEEALRRLDWPSLKDVKKEYAQIELEIEKLASSYTEEHPDVLEAKERKSEILRKAGKLISLGIEDKKNQALVLKGKINSLDDQIKTSKQKLQETSGVTQKIRELEESLNLLKEGLNEAVNKIEQEGVSPVNISVLSLNPQGVTPITEYRDINKALLIGLCLGLFVGMLLIKFLKPRML